MAEKMLAERLQPSLLDRLTDEEPTQKQESRAHRAIDITRLREIIKRDLSWLLNTNSLGKALDPEKYPHAAKSVLNYGVREVAGEYSTSVRAELIRKSILNAISVHEPRIIAGSTAVELRTEQAKGETQIAFDIHADMWAQPVPLELYLRSKVDVTTGEISLDRVG
ncbi:type VI secretion system baseplate subunit TssE [Sulfitobacter geojensis]|jgi:type VI secretion system protein ImpF|uniref:Type VI secretion system baseplate subunit TssE n=1 Tax=Sulfitobacter geojensis TaxID=1342299 RepID=A0AAE2VYX6_9RHOB|nr:type VI secretion system baseplate subunit TssE [Sulfitobacter geojensis]KHA50847.1 Type VI secretion system lysozyme-like protein [Sulfitobacter geojensis]MBM1689857.1 type VI secretion system baseplate subunit TssE [Sulfitobacter geojensis]MBM1693923.1 type VI secretion system baseplate subunit TssE [Sulfitobacter geojensis]MBM1706089.1 type VI secretion system baseplate subunit TssE [Sulfitobacter geojensis]MBM1710147.1 type VI secretion system baseplate subunit TssE [Sulfitobacter geoje